MHAGEASTGIAKLIARSMHVRDGLEEQVGVWGRAWVVVWVMY